MRIRIAVSLLLLLQTVSGALCADEIVLKHDNFKRGLHSWRIPSYWSGDLKLTDDGGRKVMLLAGTGRKGKSPFGRAYAEFKQSEQYSGTGILIHVTARGEGEFLAGLLVYHPGNRRPEYLPGKVVKLTKDFVAYEFALTIPWRCHKILPYLEVKNGGRLLVREFRLAALVDPEVKLTAAENLRIVKPGMPLEPVRFRTNRPGEKLAISQLCKDSSRDGVATADSSGTVSVEPTDQGRGLWEIAAAKSGRAACTYVIMETAEDFDRSDALAKQVKLGRPLHILILGDSLSDFFRGYNYVDRLEFWLNRYNPGQVTIRNAGVHGDYVARMRDRLRGTVGEAKNVYCQSRYDRLFDEKYDLILIFLGQNDTRTPSDLNYARPLTEPKEQYEGLKEIVGFIRGRSAAKIVLVSPSPCCEEFIRARQEKAKPGKKFVLFGKREFVDNYDLVNRRFCEELKLDYIDILDPMRKASNMKSFYIRDGVHLSLIGGRFVADEILKYFTGK